HAGIPAVIAAYAERIEDIVGVIVPSEPGIGREGNDAARRPLQHELGFVAVAVGNIELSHIRYDLGELQSRHFYKFLGVVLIVAPLSVEIARARMHVLDWVEIDPCLAGVLVRDIDVTEMAIVALPVSSAADACPARRAPGRLAARIVLGVGNGQGIASIGRRTDAGDGELPA